uniref:Uncharacterized protein n=1 Tax=Romanomermis culicivorax TaxID=13658 RepID=A0A915JC13_ROMCU
MREQKQAIEVLLHFLDDPTSIYMPPSKDASALPTESPASSTDEEKGDVDREGNRSHHLLTENPQILKELEKSMGVEMKFWNDIFESVHQRQHQQQHTQDGGYSTASDAQIRAPTDPKSTPDLDLMSGRKNPRKAHKTNRKKYRIPKNIFVGLLSGPPMIKMR